jgi:hypothetical protein
MMSDIEHEPLLNQDKGLSNNASLKHHSDLKVQEQYTPKVGNIFCF